MSLVALADSLGLSTSTVSRAMNGYSDVSARTRARVMEAAQAMGYQPHPVAHRLATGRTGAIGLVASVRDGNFLDATFAALLSGVSAVVRPMGYFALSVTLPEGDTELQELSRLLSGRLFDGIILARTRANDPRVSMLHEQGIPFITHGRTKSNAAHAWVDADNEQAFHIATARLARLGHRRIGLINGPSEMTFAALRAQGFLRALDDHGLDRDQCPIRHCEVQGKAAAEVAAQLLAHPASRRVTALVCATDAMALGAMQAIRSAGHAVGRDVSVIGYGNTEAGELADPPLTTIDHAIVDNGRHLADLLMRRMQGEPPQSLTRLEPVHLLARGSDGPAPKA